MYFNSLYIIKELPSSFIMGLYLHTVTLLKASYKGHQSLS